MDKIENIKTEEQIIDEVFNKVKENVTYLLKENYSNAMLVQNALSRGSNIIRGQLDTQTIVDLSVIALTFLIQKEKENANNKNI